MPRTILAVEEAPNEGARRLRALLLTRSLGQIAQRLACTTTAVRHWARGDRMPSSSWRDAMADELGIPAAAWQTDRAAPSELPSTEALTRRKP